MFHVVSIGDSQLSKIKYTADGFFSFHHANAFEIDDCLVVDLVTYEDGTIIQKASMENIRNGNLPETNLDSGLFWRFVFPIEIPSVRNSSHVFDYTLNHENYYRTLKRVIIYWQIKTSRQLQLQFCKMMEAFIVRISNFATKVISPYFLSKMIKKDVTVYLFVGVEFPRINYEKCNGLPYQFCYFGGKSRSNVYLLDEVKKVAFILLLVD